MLFNDIFMVRHYEKGGPLSYRQLKTYFKWCMYTFDKFSTLGIDLTHKSNTATRTFDSVFSHEKGLGKWPHKNFGQRFSKENARELLAINLVYLYLLHAQSFTRFPGLLRTKRIVPARWKMQGRHPRVQGPRVWKTRVSVENTGSKCKIRGNHYFAQQWSRKFVISNCNENQSARDTFFGHKRELNILWERKPFKGQRAMQWFCMGASIFRSNLRGFYFFEKEIMKL